PPATIGISSPSLHDALPIAHEAGGAKESASARCSTEHQGRVRAETFAATLKRRARASGLADGGAGSPQTRRSKTRTRKAIKSGNGGGGTDCKDSEATNARNQRRA